MVSGACMPIIPTERRLRESGVVLRVSKRIVVAVRAATDQLRLAPLGVSEGIRAGAWSRDFARRGVTLHQADCLIAAAALGIGAALATANIEDFPMSELSVEHWLAGA